MGTEVGGVLFERLETGSRSDIPIFAWYLSAFHRTQENDNAWGAGFTEWHNVAKGRPNFIGHNQPHLPGELGFYDLSDPTTLERQIQLASNYDLTGFAFHFYHFDGKKILRKPLDLLANDFEFPFFVSWANENWTRKWDGGNDDPILTQSYKPGFEKVFAEDVAHYLKNDNYFRIHGVPILGIYRVMSFPNPSESLSNIRKALAELGIPKVHITVVDFYDVDSATELGADSLTEFPPHKFGGEGMGIDYPIEITNPDFSGSIVDYRKSAFLSLEKKLTETTIRGIITGWDNSSRRQDNPTIFVNSNPDIFEDWLRGLLSQKIKSGEINLPVLINAWNEWGEGATLEPTFQDDKTFLRALARARWLRLDERLDYTDWLDSSARLEGSDRWTNSIASSFLKSQNEELTSRNDQLQRDILAIMNTSSWKVTRPLRLAKFFVKSFFRTKRATKAL